MWELLGIRGVYCKQRKENKMILKNPPKPPPTVHCSIRDIEWPNTRNMAKPTAERPLYIDDRRDKV